MRFVSTAGRRSKVPLSWPILGSISISMVQRKTASSERAVYTEAEEEAFRRFAPCNVD